MYRTYLALLGSTPRLHAIRGVVDILIADKYGTNREDDAALITRKVEDAIVSLANQARPLSHSFASEVFAEQASTACYDLERIIKLLSNAPDAIIKDEVCANQLHHALYLCGRAYALALEEEKKEEEKAASKEQGSIVA